MLLKRCVFKCLLKVAVDVVSRSDCGRLFHALGPATEKALEPIIIVGYCRRDLIVAQRPRDLANSNLNLLKKNVQN